jgi:hypothetical protein
MSSNLLSAALQSIQSSYQQQAEDKWPTFEEILQRLHSQGIYIHSEQLAEFLLAHGLPVHLRYVPAYLREKAIEVNNNYHGDMVRMIEELEPPYWDFSWMDSTKMPTNPDDIIHQMEENEQPSWDYSWMM